ncbi:transcription initiation factor IIB 2 (plasmid) [Halarchaeum sp. CBA1220]|uniref:transcription initiation factor IIB n=1 Tax=Halarchaeum sp. CBA1220 TaxID=1853682 RepID=UPI000F3A8443|nr:TFIIB-type zinc ribbon-containing protein [Halarchaeum sp. CBA1220]QLC34925.1 transcription initiation factor IIB 2 [Halarchaeum sp. CBA1220]
MQATTTAVGRERETSDTTTERADVCPECGAGLERDAARGEVSCRECGLIVDEDVVDRGPEWRSFDDGDENRSRVGAPTTNLMHDKGLSSVIGWQDKDAYGQRLSGRKRRQLARLRKWDERFRARDDQERNLKQALGEVERMTSALGLPKSVGETAGVVYRRALDEDLLRGRSIESVATASVYAAARQAGVPRSLDEVATVSRVERLRVQRAYRQVSRELGLEVPPTDPREYVERYASDLDLPSETVRVARDLLDTAIEANVHSGKSPTTMAGAAVYAAARLTNRSVTQEDVSEVANVARVTIRSRYKELLEVQEPAA